MKMMLRPIAAVTIALVVSIPALVHAATPKYSLPSNFKFHQINQYELEIIPVNPPKYWYEPVKFKNPIGVESVLQLNGGTFANGQTTMTALPFPKTTIAKIYSSAKVVYFTQEPKVPMPLAVSIIQPQMMQGKTNIFYPFPSAQIGENEPFANKLLHTLMHDLPESVYVLQGKVESSKKENLTFFQFKYRETPAQYAFVKTDVSKILKQIIKPGMDVYQKEFAIHNWIATHVLYDFSKAGINDQDYSALVEHKADCTGITELTYRMLSAAGIQNRMVPGNVHGGTYEIRNHYYHAVLTSNETSHIWNEVNLDGKWYMLDVTMDLKNLNKEAANFGGFNLTSTQLSNTHKWNQAAYPFASTDFVSVLQHSKNPQDKQILHAIEG